MGTSNVTWTKPGDTFIDFAQPLTHAIAAAAAAAGVDGVMQYTPYTDADRPKYGSAAEAKIAHEHGLYYMLNWEIEAERPLRGYEVGRSDGARSRAALRKIGYPETVSAPVSVDMDTLYGNKDATSGFVRGHWETDGDLCENIAYLDTDGGRVLVDQGIDDAKIWIPGALSWSPELYAYWRGLSTTIPLRTRRDMLADRANDNPQAVALQYPSEAAFGIRVDFNTVLKPFRVWCAPYEVDVPPVSRPDAIPEPFEEDDVNPYFTHSEPWPVDSKPAGWHFWRLMPDGTKRHVDGVELDKIARARATAAQLTVDEIEAIPTYAPNGGGTSGPLTLSGTFTGSAL